MTTLHAAGFDKLRPFAVYIAAEIQMRRSKGELMREEDGILHGPEGFEGMRKAGALA